MAEQIDRSMITVAVPTYNAGEKIHACLESIEAQRLDDGSLMDVVLVDDISDDGTWQAIQGSKFEHHQNQENLGLTKNWDRAIELANGPVVVLLHQDDALSPDAVQTAIELFQDPEVAMVAFSPVMRTSDGDMERPWSDLGRFQGKEYFEMLLRFKECPPPSCTFFRKDLITEGAFYESDYSYCPEFSLYLRLANQYPNKYFVHSEKALVIRGVSDDQFSMNHFYLGLIDKINIHSRFVGSLAKKEAADSTNALIRTMDNGITRMLNEGWTDQVKKLFDHPTSRKWLLKHLLKMRSSIKVGLRRTIGR